VLVRGESGCGKSSLVRLIAGLDVAAEGSIKLLGRTMTEVGTKAYRDKVAVVWQESGLLRGTLLSNLTLGAQQVSEQEIWHALEVCRISDWVREAPQSLLTSVSEFGASLSAGQRQRLCIARALLLKRPILVLDEATANLDEATEGQLLSNLIGVPGRTLMVVSHRPGIERFFDRVVELDHGLVRAATADTRPVVVGPSLS
jgi:ABC-type bacteriocin/lantibiotic exporter with double-glycine peptidase domain